MVAANTLGEVFRFTQLVPPRPPQESRGIPLVRTALAKALDETADPKARIGLANEALAAEGVTVARLGDLAFGEQLAGALAQARAQPQPTTAHVLAAVANLEDIVASEPFADDQSRLADTLLAATFGSAGGSLDVSALGDLYRVYALVAHAAQQPDAPEEPLDAFLRRPLVAPLLQVFAPRDRERPRPEAGHNPAPGNPGHDNPARRNPAAAAAELAGLDHASNLVLPIDGGFAPDDGHPPFTLTRGARAHLSEPTLALLEERGIDLDVTPVHAAVTLLSDLAEASPLMASTDLMVAAAPTVMAQPNWDLQPAPTPHIRPAGLAKLLVVKQNIKRYEAAEIAHVENVLAGETRSRTHRALERTEEIFTTEIETVREQERELETAERFELNRETAKTIKEDVKVGFGLTLSGKYGPTVEFTSNLQMDVSRSSEESAKNATNYAKDVVQRSLERIAERVREERVRRLIRETEETNLHELKNTSDNHRSGIYQFLDKIYEAQVFDYDIREMFDFMVPEPASFLWYMAAHPKAVVSLPDPPEPLEDYAPHAGFIDLSNYRYLAALYGATEIEPPPRLYQTITASMQHGDDDASERGQPRGQQKVELTVPSGYEVWRASVEALAMTDHDPTIAVTIGNRNLVWQPGNAQRSDLGSGYELANTRQFVDFTADPYTVAPENKLTVNVVAFETNTYTLNINVVCRRTTERFEQWQLSTYAKIRGAYDERVLEHAQTVAELEARAAAEAEAVTPFGVPPAQNRQVVREELRKHCLSIITRQWFDAIDATQDGTPPFFDFDEASDEGAFIRFFEQAFEWDQMQYVFYPYFWARKTTWAERFLKQDVDPEFREFWRAGAARVVVPVRPGFEVAVTHYLETGKLWDGLGEPPDVHSPLYVPIVDEIRERTGAGKGEIPVDEPWEVRLPTPLVLVRATADLPTWHRIDPQGWQWLPAELVGDGDGGPNGDG